jgi:hypothetical protein
MFEITPAAQNKQCNSKRLSSACSGGVGGSFYTCGIRHVTIVTNTVVSHE